jgi:hypothetical protein
MQHEPQGKLLGQRTSRELLLHHQTECLHRQTFQTHEAAHMTIVEYVRWYNATRRHCTIGLVAPAIFEASFITTTAA